MTSNDLRLGSRRIVSSAFTSTFLCRASTVLISHYVLICVRRAYLLSFSLTVRLYSAPHKWHIKGPRGSAGTHTCA